MSDTPDLSKIVSTIMENPAIIEQISSIMKQKNESSPESEITVTDSTEEAPADLTSEASLFKSESPKGSSRSTRRHELIRAMKPYLSEPRCKTVDTAIAIADIVDMIRR